MRINQTLVLAALPVIAYAAAFCFDAGYIGWFGVPYWLIRPDITDVLITAGAISLVLGTLLYYARFIPNWPWGVILLVWLPPTCCVAYVLLLALTAPWSWSWAMLRSLLAMLLFGLFAVVATRQLVVQPILKNTEAGDWFERWKIGVITFYSHDDYTVADRLFTKTESLIGSKASLGVVVLALVFVGLYLLGQQRAAAATEFVLVTAPTPCIAIRQYGDGIICAEVDTTAHQLLRRFRILHVGDAGMSFHNESLGKLRNASADSTRARAAPGSRP